MLLQEVARVANGASVGSPGHPPSLFGLLPGLTTLSGLVDLPVAYGREECASGGAPGMSASQDSNNLRVTTSDPTFNTTVSCETPAAARLEPGAVSD